MASTKLMETKDGKRFWKISVSRGYGKSPYTSRFYWQDGWSERYALQQLKKAVGTFETKCSSGEVLSRQEQKEQEEEKAREEAKISTLKQYGEKVFMPTKGENIAENTRHYYQNALTKHIYPALGNFKMTEITSAQISAFFLGLAKDGLSYSTATGIYVTLSQLFKMAYLSDLIDRNPMDKVQRPRQKKDERASSEVKAFTADELKTILGHLDQEPLRWQAMIRLMIDTGIRRGEAGGLKWENIDLTTNTAKIGASLNYTAERGVYLSSTKTGKSRDVYFSAATAALLTRIRDEQIASVKVIDINEPGKPISDFVFNQKGSPEPMHPTSVTHYFRSFSDKYGIEDFHPHKLRHSFASVAITNGADVASVSEVLGHADKSTTLRMYTHANAESKRRAANLVLDAIAEGQ